MTRYITITCAIGLAFAGLYILLLRSDLALVKTERDYLKINLETNIQFIANDTERRRQNETIIQGQLVDLAEDDSPDRPVGPLLGGVIDRMPAGFAGAPR